MTATSGHKMEKGKIFKIATSNLWNATQPGEGTFQIQSP